MYIFYTNTGQNISHFLLGSLLLYPETSTSCARDRPLGLVWFGLVWQYQTNPTSGFVWFLLFASLLVDMKHGEISHLEKAAIIVPVPCGRDGGQMGAIGGHCPVVR